MKTALYVTLGLVAATAAVAEPQVVWTLDGFSSPESVAVDPASGLLYVSNFGVDPMKKDGDGTIARITADGKLDTAGWVVGLDAPKGMDVAGGKLYVADLDQLVEIDTASGQVTNRYPAVGAQFLNDVAAAPDGRIFVSDTFGGAVYVLEGGVMSLFVQDATMLSGANGLLVVDGALLVADLGDLSGGFANIKPGPVVQVDLASKAISYYGAEGPVGILDGIEPDGQGGVLLTDNPQGKLLRLKPGGTAEVVATLEGGLADMEWLPDQGLVIIPVTPANKVIALKLD